MSKIDLHRNARTVACTMALLLASAGLSACGGGSSQSGSTAANTPATQAGHTPAGMASGAATTTSGASTTATPTTAPASTKPSQAAPVNKAANKALASKAFAQTLARFADCLRRQGVKIPAPNTSGKGPVFSTKGVDTRSRAFQVATSKCREELLKTLRSQQSKLAKR